MARENVAARRRRLLVSVTLAALATRAAGLRLGPTKLAQLRVATAARRARWALRTAEVDEVVDVDAAIDAAVEPSEGISAPRLSPGYGFEGRQMATEEPKVKNEVEENLAAVYADLQELDRAARHVLASGLLFGIQNAEDIQAMVSMESKTKTKDARATQRRSSRKGTVSVRTAPDGSVTAAAAAEVAVEESTISSTTTTTTTTTRSTKKATRVRSKILRTGKRSVQDRLEKVNGIMPVWLTVAHSADVPKMKTKLIEIDGIPIVVWRDQSGRLSALSDVCIHRGASLAKGWVSKSGCVACPYHGFEYEHDGALVRTANVMGRDEHETEQEAIDRIGRIPGDPPQTVSYPVREAGGWIQVFPRSTVEAFGQLHAPETVLEPLHYPELSTPGFRAIQGSVDINGSVDATMENVLDMLHISYVHLFGNAQEPLPISTDYSSSYDDPDPNRRLLKSGKVVFTYNAGPRAWSKVVGGADVVRVENEFHLPYTAIIRVHFSGSTKTIVASALPLGKKRTRLNYKLYRNFAITHEKDEGPINWFVDRIFEFFMMITLNEDKVIVEDLYEDYRVGLMNGKYDKQQLTYRRAVTELLTKIDEREMQIRSGLFDEVAVPGLVDDALPREEAEA
uniref:Rieske domain-containing protein n=1 Tax=Phaeomonas parva TaxID=124430 RepID=A0A6U4DAF0_9STRA|mmetsp:Transcript_15957/g.48715  ORF Transcript_15957/g.48715 Transcript_15957/m.48715 type:complete len:624 (+) Transcript_15957:455-2326(+)